MRIGVALAVVGGEAQLRVEDHGVGIPRDEQDRVFQPYLPASSHGTSARSAN